MMSLVSLLVITMIPTQISNFFLTLFIHIFHWVVMGHSCGNLTFFSVYQLVWCIFTYCTHIISGHHVIG